MNIFKKNILFISFLLFCQFSNASVVELIDGSLNVLKGNNLVNVQYDFSDLIVNGYPTIDEYVAFKKKKFEEFHKGAKTGEEWYKNWIYDREHVMIPRIEDVLNKKMEKCGIAAKQNAGAKYTLIIKINHYIESNAGWPYFIGVVSMFEAKIYLVETAAPEKKLAYIRADYCNEVGDLGGSIGNLICKELK